MKNNNAPMFLTCRRCGLSDDYSSSIDKNGDCNGSLNCHFCGNKLEVEVKNHQPRRIVRQN